MPKSPTQLEFGVALRKEPDRNFSKGGRSFYFFDFDDNVMHLPTPIFIFHRETGEERAVSTGEFARISHLLGQPGPYAEFQVDPDDRTGSFRRFRDHPHLGAHQHQPFVEDITTALSERPDFEWKGPSWECFEYAVHNERPIAVITARGHHPDTIRQGIAQLVDSGFLSREPNYLDIVPVSRPETRALLAQERKLTTAELKRQAVIQCVEKAFFCYGLSPFHRFGMSDDDAQNILWITAAKRELKARYPENSFFVIHADQRPFQKEEVFADSTSPTEFESFDQLELGV